MLEKRRNGVKAAGDMQGGRRLWFEAVCMGVSGWLSGPLRAPQVNMLLFDKGVSSLKEFDSAHLIKEKLPGFLTF